MSDFRVGFGYDSHRFEAGRKLMLGGVEIAGETGLKGHSDADVVIHAVIDALLGAAALGDIGSHFPHRSGIQSASAPSERKHFPSRQNQRHGGGRFREDQLENREPGTDVLFHFRQL